MPMLDVYIGHLAEGDDPLDWGGDPNIGNTPKRIGPLFPPRPPFSAVIRKIEAGALAGKQVDWGAYAANVTKQEIFDLIEETYRDDRIYSDPTCIPHLYPKLAELKAFVTDLPDGRYALVASEL